MKSKQMIKTFFKFSTVFVTAIIALTGCSNNSTANTQTPVSTSELPIEVVIETVEPSADASDASDAPDTSDTSDTPDNTASANGENDITAMFQTPNGEPVDLEGAVVNGMEGEIPLSEMAEGNWFSVSCEYVYLAEPVGVYYDSERNADIFDKDNFKFSNAPETVVHEYKKYKVGDYFGDLKIARARTSFAAELGADFPKYFNGGMVKFDGQVTLKGKCRISPEDDVYIAARDILFVPDPESKALPIMNYCMDEEGNEELFYGMANDFCWLSEYTGFVALGNMDSYPDMDLSFLPEDGSFVDVEVTLDNVFFRHEKNFTISLGAKIVDMKSV